MVAAAAGQTKKGHGRAGQDERFRLLDDGALSNAKVERYALFLVDGVAETSAWRLAGYALETGYAKDWRRRVKANAAFQSRLKTLEAEKLMLDQSDSPFASAKWSALQLWREARAKDDLGAATKAADLLFKIAEREADVGRVGAGKKTDSAPPTAGDRPGPGRPAVQVGDARPASLRELAGQFLDRGASNGSAT